MSVEVSLQQQLTLKQQKLIACLIAGSSIVDAARQVGIAEKTVHAWKKQPAFIAALQEARNLADREIWQSAMQQLKNSIPQALQVLARHASAEDVEITASSQLRAAITLVEKALQIVEIEEIKKRLAALEERLK